MAIDEEDKLEIERAEAKIREGEATIALGEQELQKGEQELSRALHHDHHPTQYSYTVDGKEYLTDSKSLTSLQIKSKVPNVNLAYQLVEESHGSAPDRVVTDNETVMIDVKPAPVFYLVPPATFG